MKEKIFSSSLCLLLSFGAISKDFKNEYSPQEYIGDYIKDENEFKLKSNTKTKKVHKNKWRLDNLSYKDYYLNMANDNFGLNYNKQEFLNNTTKSLSIIYKTKVFEIDNLSLITGFGKESCDLSKNTFNSEKYNQRGNLYQIKIRYRF